MTKTKLYTLYMLLFPDGYFYFGSTSVLVDRKSKHKRDLQRGLHKKYIQEQYDKQGSCEFIELSQGDEYTIRCKEHFYIKDNIDDAKCLNKKNTWPPHIIKIAIKKGSKAASRAHIKENYNHKEWKQTPLGKLTQAIDNARTMVKYYFKKGNNIKLKEWEYKLEERLQHRELFKNEA